MGIVVQWMCPEELMAEPHTMLLMLNSRWEYAYTPNGEALALQTFMLTEPAIYCLEVWGRRGGEVGGSWDVSRSGWIKGDRISGLYSQYTSFRSMCYIIML